MWHAFSGCCWNSALTQSSGGWSMCRTAGSAPRVKPGKLKAMGTKPGYPDLTLPRPSHLWRGLAIELKSPDGRVSPEQVDWLNAFLEDDWLVAVCRSLDEFIAVVRRFLINTPLPPNANVLWQTRHPAVSVSKTTRRSSCLPQPGTIE